MLKKFLAISGTLALAASLAVVAVPIAAQAAQPLVTGTAACNPDTSQFDITWTVAGDAALPDQTATVVSEQLDSDAGEEPVLLSSLVGQSVIGSGSIQAVQEGATPYVTYTLTLGVESGGQDSSEVVAQQSAPVQPYGSCADSSYQEASASLSTTRASCDAAGTLVLGETVNAGWGEVAYNDNRYSVIATAAEGRFPEGEGVSGYGATKLFEGALEAQLTGSECAPPPACIPSTAVSYTYDQISNSGTISVAPVPSISGTLCEGFWVTATSWKYATGGIWPQTLDKVDFVNFKQQITVPGDYPFQAVMSCGQGDIYASFTEQPVPTSVLTGPSTPYKEFFLHQMGFTQTGSTDLGPTYYNQAPGCNAVKPVAPVVTTSAECGVASTVVAGPTPGVKYVVDFDPTSGDYKITATPAANYIFAGDYDQKKTFEGNAGALVECVQLPRVTAFATCATDIPSGGPGLVAARVSDSGQIAHLTFDNSDSTAPVLFQVIGFPEFDRTVPAGEVVKIEILNSTQGGSSYRVMAAGETFVLPIPSCQLPDLALVTPTYSTRQATCASGATYTLGSTAGDIVWTINGKPSVSSGSYRAPADFSDVTITAAPAAAEEGLDPNWVNPLVLRFASPSAACMFDPPTLALDPSTASFNPPTLAYTGRSTAAGSGLGLGGALLFVGIAVIFVSRRRKPEAE